MKQITFASTGFELSTKRTRKRQFLEEMQLVVPWADLLALIEPFTPKSTLGRPPFSTSTMLRIYFLQQWFCLSDPAMEEALHDTPLLREFAQLDAGASSMPDESTILRFRHLLETHHLAKKILETVNAGLTQKGLLLKAGTLVDATLIAAPSSTKNVSGKRDPEMKSTKKGEQHYFGMKAHIGVDAQSGLVHTVVTTAANVHDVTQAHQLLHGQENEVFADSGYRGVTKRKEMQGKGANVAWNISMMPSKRKSLNGHCVSGQLSQELEKVKAKIRSKVEHVFRVIKCQFNYRKTRYVGLYKNTHQQTVLFALSNLWLARKRILQEQKG